jgi:hypothetical protein
MPTSLSYMAAATASQPDQDKHSCRRMWRSIGWCWGQGGRALWARTLTLRLVYAAVPYRLSSRHYGIICSLGWWFFCPSCIDGQLLSASENESAAGGWHKPMLQSRCGRCCCPYTASWLHVASGTAQLVSSGPLSTLDLLGSRFCVWGHGLAGMVRNVCKPRGGGGGHIVGDVCKIPAIACGCHRQAGMVCAGVCVLRHFGGGGLPESLFSSVRRTSACWRYLCKGFMCTNAVCSGCSCCLLAHGSAGRHC